MLQTKVPRIAVAAVVLWLSAVTPLPAAETAAATNHLDQVIVVFKTHFDIGYTDMASNVVQRYRTTMIDQALEVVDQNRDLPPEQQFVWTIPGWPMHKILRGLARPDAGAQAARPAGVQGRPLRGPRPAVHHAHRVAGSRRTWCAAWASPRGSRRAAGLPLPRDAQDDRRARATPGSCPRCCGTPAWTSCTSAATPPAARRRCRRCSGGKARTARAC